MIGSTLFRDALSRFPSGVTIVTGADADGRPHGFTASAFCAVSLTPPLVCVCLARSARCHPVFASQSRFTVSFLRPEHTALAAVFADKSADKFRHGFLRHREAAVVVDNALAVLDCSVHDRYEAGDHTILIGAVEDAELSAGEPLVLHDRRFHRLRELGC